jgi:hypothetical protein
MIDSNVLRIDDLELLFYYSYLYYTTISVDKTEKVYERFNKLMVLLPADDLFENYDDLCGVSLAEKPE